MFLTASTDWKIKLWNFDRKEAVLLFDVGGAVGSVAWAPYSSTIFAAALLDGRVLFY
jgi:dynein intermediate chain 1